MPALNCTERLSKYTLIDLYLFCFSSPESSICPFASAALTQVEIIRSFTAKQPDELSLQVADVVLIYQRVNDGEWKCSYGSLVVQH